MLRRKAPAVLAPAAAQLELFGMPAWMAGYLGLCAVHMACYFAAKARGTPEVKREPHVAAHTLPQLLGFAFMAYNGAYGWLFVVPASPDGVDAVGGHVPLSEVISCYMISFQLYELTACIPAPRLRGQTRWHEMIIHHGLGLLLALLAYYYTAFHHFVPGFMGISEISSLPLALMDHFKAFPKTRAAWPVTNEVVRHAFVILFLPIRAFYWPYQSLPFWRITTAMETHASVPDGVVYVFQFVNLVMTFLQWFWASLIVRAIHMKVTGDPRHKDQ